MQHPHLFGPIKSRRLGISLGVDMTPFKTCSLDCIYCECGATTNLAANCLEYVSSKELIEELEDYLSHAPALDYITFAGSGEPTLNSALFDVVTFLKSNFPNYKTALLTNGTLFHIDSVFKTALLFDLVAPSVDAVTEQSFKKINRPHPDIALATMIDSLIEFSKDYDGKLLIEVFIIPGINDTPQELALFKSTFERMKFTTIQLNSLDRPGTDRSLKTAPGERLHQIAQFFSPLQVEIISRSTAVVKSTEMQNGDPEEMVLSIIRRRPSTSNDLCSVIALSESEITDIITVLESKGLISHTLIQDKTFYNIV